MCSLLDCRRAAELPSIARFSGLFQSRRANIFAYLPTTERLMKTKKTFAASILVLPFFCLSSVCGADGFESVRCGGDVRKAMVGRRTANEPVVVIEARHKDIDLKDLGAEIISDDERLNLIFWRICGEEYAVLECGDIVKDVLKFPKHSKDSPQFVGSCQLNDHDVGGVV